MTKQLKEFFVPVDRPTQCNQCDKVHPKGTLFLFIQHVKTRTTINRTCEYCCLPA